jgi:hypothetical protein
MSAAVVSAVLSGEPWWIELLVSTVVDGNGWMDGWNASGKRVTRLAAKAPSVMVGELFGELLSQLIPRSICPLALPCLALPLL